MYLCMKKGFIFIFFVFMLASCGDDEDRYGSTIEVPNEILTIQEAIYTAKPNDTILLHPGEYYENIVIDKALCIKSIYDAEDSLSISETVIDGTETYNTIWIENINDTVKIDGLTIRKGWAISNASVKGGGIYCKNSNLILTNLIVTRNFVMYPTYWGDGGGIFCDSSYLELTNVMVVGNKSFHFGGGLECKYSNVIITDSEISKNIAGAYAPAIRLFKSNFILENTIIKDNDRGVNPGVPSEIDYLHEFVIISSIGNIKNCTVKNDSLLITGESNVVIIDSDIPGYKN